MTAPNCNPHLIAAHKKFTDVPVSKFSFALKTAKYIEVYK